MVIHSKPRHLTVLLLYPVIVTYNFFTHEELNSFQCARAFQVEKNLEVLVFEEKEKTKNPRKSSWSKEENQKQTQPSYGVDVGI